MGMEIFQEIGQEVEERWAVADRDPEAFAEVAHAVLSAAPVEAHTSPEELLAWTATQENLPLQVNAGSDFGNPPITLFAGDGFYIEVLFWLDGIPSVHEHAFAGAFRVLSGGSCQSTYSFEERDRPSPWVRFGRLIPETVRLLAVGDCLPIVPGPSFIHGLFHLERPSVTVVVRTPRIERYAPQFDYYPSGFAIAPFHEPPVMLRRLEVLECLAELDPRAAEEIAGQMMSSADLHGVFKIMKVVRGGLGASVTWKLARRAREVHGDHMEPILRAVEGAAAAGNVQQRRHLVKSDDHRFFLGLLVCLTSRSDILRLIEERHPDMDPVERALGWLEELAATPVPDAEAYGPNVLGMELDPMSLALCAGRMRGEREEDTIARILEDPSLEPPDVARVHQLAMLLPNTALLGRLLGE